MTKLVRTTLRRDDKAVSEVVGYILSFALSAVFLLIALTSFWTAQQNTDGVVTAAEMKTLATKVASRIVEAGLVGQEFSNASLNVTVPLPQDVNGHTYKVTASSAAVTVTTDDGLYSAVATTFKLDAVTSVLVSGTVPSSNEKLVVSYSLNGNQQTISIHG